MTKLITELAYLKDSYLKECDAKVIEVDGTNVVLDRTIFYPRGGGQLSDKGMMINAVTGLQFNVLLVKKVDGKIVHELDSEGLNVEDNVVLKLDWERRYKLMRMHTAAHLISAIINKRMDALITGNQLDIEKSRIDFNIESFDKESAGKIVAEANELIKKDANITTYELPRAEVESRPELVKLANRLPPMIDILRIVEIVGVDVQADGGTHVNHLSEIGKISLLKVDNKGKNNRRIYFKLETMNA